MNIPYLRTLSRLGCALVAVVLLTGCESVLTGISAPASVAPGETFEVVVTHEFLTGGPLATGFTESALAFGMFIPNGWSINPESRYVGNWDGTDIELALVEGPLPTDTNFFDLFVDQADPPPGEEEEALIRTLDCKGLIDVIPVPSDLRFVYLQTTPSPLPNTDILNNDGGEFQISMTAGGPGGTKDIAAIHGFYFVAEDAEIGEGESPETVTLIGCLWYPEDFTDDVPPEGEFIIPSAQLATINQTGSSVPVAVPVPLGGGLFAALLGLLLLGAGLMVGRRFGHI